VSRVSDTWDPPTLSDGRIHLSQVGSAIAVCRFDGALVAASPLATRLFSSVGIQADSLPTMLPSALWGELGRTPLGEAIEWRPPGSGAFAVLGFSMYRMGETHRMLQMREISMKHVELSRRLHQQRLEAIGRLVAMVAHDLRAPLASIVFNADLISKQPERFSGLALSNVAAELRNASDRLSWTVDGLLDFARLGPPLSVDVDVEEVFRRVSSLTRPVLRDGSHRLVTHVVPGAETVRGNSLVVEQIVVNLVLNAAEAAVRPASIEVRAEPPANGDALVRLVVQDDGPGIPLELRERIFEPFFTTKSRGTGIGLSSAREATRDLGGDLRLLEVPSGACFLVTLPLPVRSATEGSA
jgi:signal transduction histidine kinase